MSSVQPPPFQKKQSRFAAHFVAIVIVVAVILVSVVLAIVANDNQRSRQSRNEFKYVYPSADGEIVSNRIGFSAKRPFVYIDKSGSLTSLKEFFTITLDGKTATAGMFELDGKPEKAKLYSNDINVVYITHPDDPSEDELIDSFSNIKGEVHFEGPGTAEIKAKIGNLVSVLTIRVVQIDIDDGDSAESVIKKLGFPDRKENDFPFGENWYYNKHPNLEISIEDEKVRSVTNEH